jgi:toxin ParE1/3/4
VKAIAFSPAAETDIEEIWDYSAVNWGLDQADHYIDDLRDACIALAGGRRRGRTVDVRPGYLKLSVGSHIIYFRDEGDRLEIIRVLHNRRDVERHL